jgi:hypothetical protein
MNSLYVLIILHTRLTSLQQNAFTIDYTEDELLGKKVIFS